MQAAEAQCGEKSRMVMEQMMRVRLQYQVNVAKTEDYQFNAIPPGFLTKARGCRVERKRFYTVLGSI